MIQWFPPLGAKRNCINISTEVFKFCLMQKSWKRPWSWERLKAGGEADKEDEIVGWHHRLHRHEFEQAPGVGDGQGTWRAPVHGVAKSWTGLSGWTEHRKKKSQSVVSDSLWPLALYSPWNSPGQNTWVGRHSPLQGIFPTQGWNPGLPHYRRFFTVWATKHWWGPNNAHILSEILSETEFEKFRDTINMRRGYILLQYFENSRGYKIIFWLGLLKLSYWFCYHFSNYFQLLTSSFLLLFLLLPTSHFSQGFLYS